MNKIKSAAFAAIVFCVCLAGCATESGPQFSAPTGLQPVLNSLLQQTPIRAAGAELTIEFRGAYWVAKVDGKENMAGTYESVDNDNGSVITLKQTHTYQTKENPVTKKEIGWVKAGGAKITLDYQKGPPESITAK